MLGNAALLTIPADLVKAPERLVKCYRTQPFASDAKQVQYLFELYKKYTRGLVAGKM